MTTPLDVVTGRFGPFATVAHKPLSIVRRTLDGTALLKIYRFIEPQGRRDREADALALAGQWGLGVPSVQAVGEHGDAAWAVLDIVPGTACSIATTADIEVFIGLVLTVTQALQSHSRHLAPGDGWRGQALGAAESHRDVLLGQLSPRCHRRPWWDELSAALAPLDQQPTVYLHGDIKPEHLLTRGSTVCVVDWEASFRGPAGCDYADAVFHLVRDLVYAGVSLPDLPIASMSRLPVTGPIAAWRVARWLDRRRAADIDVLPPGGLQYLAAARTAAHVVRSLARLVAALRDQGVPR